MIEAALFVIAAIAAVYLLRPAFAGAGPAASDPRTALEAASATALRAAQDLELDWATGKLSDADYAAQRQGIETEMASIQRRLDAVEPRR